MNKSTYYIVAIVLLVLGNLGLLFSDKSWSKSPERSRYFDAKDLVSIRKISFTNGDHAIYIERVEGEWRLNEQYKVDEGFFNTLLSVLERVEVTREINEWKEESLGSVEITSSSGNSVRFDFGTNPTKTKSYFITKDAAAEVSVPGYRDNVADIFMLHPDQWRDRLVFDGSWRTIQKLIVDYSDDREDLEIVFDDTFFLVNGKTPSDSSAVVDYLNQFQYFQANEMISDGRFPDLDSLSLASLKATLSIDDIKNDQLVILKVYENLTGQGYHLVTSDLGEKMVIDSRRMSSILKSPSDLGVQ